LRALKFKSTFLPRSALPRSAGAISLLVVASALSACNSSKMIGDLNPSETLTQGYVIDQQAIDLVPVGSSREQVLLALGTPSTKATFDNEAFYYISQTRKRYVAFDKPRLVDQKVLAVYFGEDGRVTQIANYGLKDGKVFDFISRTTPTGGKDQNFLSQIINGASKLAPGLPGGGGSSLSGT
jgi:outer membrane protein assembly factor BamE (lipoprotein component of BamABCDE complex)